MKRVIPGIVLYCEGIFSYDGVSKDSKWSMHAEVPDR